VYFVWVLEEGSALMRWTVGVCVCVLHETPFLVVVYLGLVNGAVEHSKPSSIH
jgi:hypothetical protein